MWGFLKYPVYRNGGLCMKNMVCFWHENSCLIPPYTTSCFSKGWKCSHTLWKCCRALWLYILQHLPCKEPKWLFNNISLLALQEQWLMAKTIPVGRKEKSMIIPQEYWSAPGISQHSSVTITSNSLYSNKLFLSMKQSSVACFVSCLKSARKSSSGK